MAGRALLSIHDLMPETLPQISGILELLKDAQVPAPSLLVVPGAGWDGEGISCLTELAREGYPLVAHGWEHLAPPPNNLFHSLHARIISRGQAEHLSRSREELNALVRRSFRWFQENGLAPPTFYVPPAWAMGALTRADLIALPFRGYEVLRGLLDGRDCRLHTLPLVGFEADNAFRRITLRGFNKLNRYWASITKLPVRISIHPYDLEFLLGLDLERLTREPWSYLREEELLQGGIRS